MSGKPPAGWVKEELSWLLSQALGLQQGASFESKEFDRRGDALWAQTEDPFIREALQGMWDYSSEYLDWGQPAEQLPLQIDLHLLKYFSEVDSKDLCRCRKLVFERIAQEQGRIWVSDDMLSHLTLLGLGERSQETIAGYDLGYLDQILGDCLRDKAGDK